MTASASAVMLGRAGLSLLVLTTVTGLAYAVIVAVRKHPQVEQALEPYTLESTEPPADAADARFGRSLLVRRAVRLTTALASRLRILGPLERRLEQAVVPMPAGELLFFQAGAAVVLTVLSFAVQPGLTLPLLAVVVAAIAPLLTLRWVIARRRRAFAAQLPEALRMLANSLRTGRSFLQGVQAVAQEADEPMASELGRVVAQARLGRAMEDALEEAVRRMGSTDGLLVTAAVRIQRRIGGNLAELLSNVAEAIVGRERMRGEVKALTAEGRISAAVLAILPLILAVVMSVVNPTYMSVLFHDPLGRAMVVGACLLAGVGFIWMKKAMEIEV